MHNMERYYSLVSSYDPDKFTREEQMELFIKRLKNTKKDEIIGSLQSYHIPGIRKMKKKAVLELLYRILKNTFDISQSKSLGCVVKLQRLWRQRGVVPENTEDPFTFDTIDDIPKELRYGYVDELGHYYVFNVVELECFIRHEGCWNPYTKQKIPNSDIFRMYKQMKTNKIQQRRTVLQWQNNTHALTDMSMAMEMKGFYNDVEWLKKLSFSKCLKTISIYRDISESNDYFGEEFELSRRDYTFVFCKEVIRLFKNSDRHYLLCCNFVKALAMNLEDLYNNLPEWLLSIESQSTYLNNGNGLLFNYIQNILSEIGSHQALRSIDVNYI